MVVDVLFVEFYLVELCKLEVEVAVLNVEQCRGVCRVVNRSVRLYECRTGEGVAALVVFCNGDVEVANNAFVLLELEVCPLSFVHKLFEGLLQVLEHRLVGTLYLVVVDGYLCLQLLRWGVVVKE